MTMHEHNVNSYCRAIMFISNTTRPKNSWKSNRRRWRWSKIRREISLANDPSEELWTNLKSSKDTNSSCTSSKEGENDTITSKKPGNASAIFHATSSGCDAAFNRSSRSYNQVLPLPPPSSSTSWFLFLLFFIWNLPNTSSFCPPYCNCDDVALSVDCSHSASNLAVLPIFLNPQITHLSLSRNNIKDIQMSLQFYDFLTQLDLSSNKIENLGENNFENLRNLQFFNVSFNQIKTLKNNAFFGLSSLRVILLAGNQLEDMENNIFKHLTSVKEINLDRNRLSSLSWDLFENLETLERISAAYNFIQVIQPSFFVSSGVRGLTSNYKNTSDGVNNKTFSSSKGEVSGWTLKSVGYIDLSFNHITRIRDYGFINFGAALKEINLESNYLHTLEEKAFIIGKESTKEKTRGNLSINLRKNQLRRIPKSLQLLRSSLGQLDISANRLTEISKNDFKNLVNLESLVISDNPEILQIDPDALSDQNKLRNFEANFLHNLTDISPNLLKGLSPNLLENFSFKFASITVLSKEFYTLSSVVYALDLKGNPLVCDNCTMYSLYEFLSNAPYKFDQSIPMDDNLSIISHQSTWSSDHSRPSSKNHFRPNLLYAQCQSPSTLAGVLIKDLKPSDFEHCFTTSDDQFIIIVIVIAASIISIIFLTLVIKLCCFCGVYRRIKTYCSTAKCCHVKSRKEKDSSGGDKLFFDSMTIALRRGDMVAHPITQPPNNIPNASTLLYCGNGTSIPIANGCVIGSRIGGNGNNLQISMDYEDDDSYQDDDVEDYHQIRHEHYPPIEPPPPIPTQIQFQNYQAQSLCRKQQQQQKHYQHNSTIGYSPKHFSYHRQPPTNPPLSPRHHHPPVLYDRKQIPSVLV